MNQQSNRDGEQKTFDEFIRRIRGGDAAATEELVRRYEPMIRREVRMHLEDPRLTRLFDSLDVCQSVLASFFIRAAGGQYDLRTPPQLINLLVEMARRKLALAARRQYRQRRDIRRVTDRAGEAVGRAVASGPDPSEIVAGQELLKRFRQCLSAEERQLAEWRSDGISWAEIAERLGGTAGARRLQLTRAVDRVTRELGLDERGD
jgi:RNA polymerase sigma-70 factor (ECF subfamily)